MINTFTIRQHVADVAERLERELGEEQSCFIEGCQRDWDRLPPPDNPLTVGIDGGFIRAPRKEGHFEVIAGKSMLSFRRHEDGDQGKPAGKCFAFVQTFDHKPKRRLFELLKNQGMQANQQIVFLSDGGEDVRNLQLYLNPQAEHLLDWFHVTRHLQFVEMDLEGAAFENQEETTRKLLKAVDRNLTLSKKPGMLVALKDIALSQSRSTVPN